MTDRAKEHLILTALVVILVVSFSLVGYASFHKGFNKGYHAASIDRQLGRVTSEYKVHP